MIQSAPEITRTQLILQALGPRPDSSAVDAAKAKIAALESKLSENVGVDRVEVEKEMEIYKAVVRLDDMHEAYVRQLRDLEERLVGVYDAVVGELEKGCEESEEVNEEVVGILRQAAAEAVEKVELSGRQLKFLPEAFGKLHGCLCLICLTICLSRTAEIGGAQCFIQPSGVPAGLHGLIAQSEDSGCICKQA